VANNLRVNGYRVTYFHDYIDQLREYVDGIRTRPLPIYSQIRDELAKSDVVLYDSTSPFTAGLPGELGAWFSTNGVCYGVTHLAPVHRDIERRHLFRRSNQIGARDAALFAALNVSLRATGPALRRKPMAHQLADAVTGTMQLPVRVYSNGLDVPRPDTPTRRNRVVIHPTSSNADKNWSAQGYIALAVRLAARGWHPVLTVSPAERERWQCRVGDRIEVQTFASIRGLAEYYAASFAFIGNDSGAAAMAAGLDCAVHRPGTFAVFRQLAGKGISQQGRAGLLRDARPAGTGVARNRVVDSWQAGVNRPCPTPGISPSGRQRAAVCYFMVRV